MIAVDTSSFIAFLAGEESEDTALVTQALKDETLILPPFVVTELFSARNLDDGVKAVILDLPQLVIPLGFWERAGEMRSTILLAGKKARTLDSMIAACCIVHDVPLIARDGDYRHFTAHFGLRLLPTRASQ